MQIKLKNSVVQDSAPSTSDLPDVGELAVNGNINSIGGFMRASDNSIVKIFGPGSVTTPTATTTVSGIAELATSAETTTGSATNRVVTPAGLNAVTVAERSTSNSTYLALAGGTLTGVVAATAGSNSAPSIHFGDSDSGIFGGTNTVSLAAGGTTRLTADTGVSVVGTLAVTGAIISTSDLTIPDKIIHSGDTNTAIRFPAADTVSVETGGSEAIRVDSSQRLLVGSSTSVDVGSGAAAMLQVEHTGSNLSAALYSTINATGPAGVLALGHARGSASGILLDNDVMGQIRFAGGDGVDLESVGAQISAEVDGTPGSNDMPGRLEFRTTADGSSSSLERMRIDSSGKVGIGNSSPAFLLDVRGATANSLRLGNTGETTHGSHDSKIVAGNSYYQNFDFQGSVYKFQTYNGSSLNERMRISSDGVVDIYSAYTNAVGGTTRDLFVRNDGRLGYLSSIRASKTNIVDLTDISWLNNLKPQIFNMRKQNDLGEYTDSHYDELEYGLIAEDVESVNKELCSYSADNVLESVQYRKLVIPLLKAVQELTAKVAALEAA